MSWASKALVLAGYTAASALLALLAAAPPLQAQYPGHTTQAGKVSKAAPVLRSIAVLEWTGDAGKPSASRLVPVSVYDGEKLNDGNIYLNRPQPLALDNGTEYELQQKGQPIGLFDLFGAGEHDGAWRGFGAWKPLSASTQAAAKAAVNTSSLYAGGIQADDDHPVLKRKHPKGTDGDDAPRAKSAPAIDSSASDTKAADADPDRPTLHKKSTAATDSDGAGTGTPDPDRPTLHRARKQASDEAGMAETSTAEPDPDRPRLKRGKPANLGATEAPKLEGMPPALQQAVAVSDAAKHSDHPWRYSWADPADEDKMKSALEEMARKELGLEAPAPAPAKPVRKSGARRPAPAKPVEPAIPVDLADERFQVFELAYGSPATMVLSAAAPASREALPEGAKPAPRKFVTLIAQPDLYGGVLVLTKNVTDAAHLDQTPQMRLVDAVDAMGDSRAELLFELRGDGQRQFALYRVLRGSAEQMFATVAIP